MFHQFVTKMRLKARIINSAYNSVQFDSLGDKTCLQYRLITVNKSCDKFRDYNPTQSKRAR